MPKRAKPAYYAAQAISERHMSRVAVDPAIAAVHMDLSEKSNALAIVVMTYRLFCMDWFGRIMGVETIEAASDEEAVEIARELDLGIKCEVWNGQRLIAKIERHAVA